MKSQNINTVIKSQVYLGVFFLSLSTLMYEILLTRIFSVTMMYHFGFFAISVAMFALAFGDVLVHIFSDYFDESTVYSKLAFFSFLVALFEVISFMVHLIVPFIIQRTIFFLCFFTVIYILISIPFIFSGMCSCLVLTRFPKNTNQLYSTELIGGAVGCIILIPILNISGGITSIFAIAFLTCLGAFFFAVCSNQKIFKLIVLIFCIFFASFTFIHTLLVNKQMPLLRLRWVYGKIEQKPLYEKWNSFSRITIVGDPNKLEKPFGWGFSKQLPDSVKIHQLILYLNPFARTPITGFDGNFKKHEYLKYDVTNIAHYLKHDAKVLVIAAGAGRDILSALVFKQKSIEGVEINGDIIRLVNNILGDFTGHLDKMNQVSIINDDARTYIGQVKNKYDIIQATFPYTAVETLFGGYVFSENYLYTIEAWKDFLRHLKPDGILSFSVRYFSRSPISIYKLISLTNKALKENGINSPRKHIVIVNSAQGTSPYDENVSTLLVSNAPFTDKDLKLIEDVAYKLDFKIILSPKISLDPIYSVLTSDVDINRFASNFPKNISAPTDDKPFFFFFDYFHDVFNLEKWKHNVINQPILMLVTFLLFIIFLVVICIFIPMLITCDLKDIYKTVPFIFYFANIGFAFMFVEIAIFQKLNLFLGNPTYALSVVLFCLLLSAGIGSYVSKNLICNNFSLSSLIYISLLLAALLIMGICSPNIISYFVSSNIWTRICVASIIISIAGLFMGTAFPVGVRLSLAKCYSFVPFFLGICSAASICATVIAMLLSLCIGISFVYWIGFLFYIFTLISLLLIVLKIS